MFLLLRSGLSGTTAAIAKFGYGSRFSGSVFKPRFISSSTTTAATATAKTWNGTKFRKSSILACAGGVFGLLGISSIVYIDGYAPTTATHPHMIQNQSGGIEKSSITHLIRAYVVYSMCSVPFVVDYAPGILEFLLGVPIVGALAGAVVRISFFDQFVGGDSAEECIPILRQLRNSNVGALFAYSVEVDERVGITPGTRPYKMALEEMIHSIEVAGDYEMSMGSLPSQRKTWVAIKLTALLEDPNSLIRLSKLIAQSHKAAKSPIPFPGTPKSGDLDFIYAKHESLSLDDITSLKELHEDMIRVCQKAKERGVKLIVDAEHSWYQPAIDAIALSLMRMFNSENEGYQPLIYNTVQAYHRRGPLHLQALLQDAKTHNYTAGIKLVRGAYHQQENLAFNKQSSSDPDTDSEHNLVLHGISTDPQPPVWSTKEDTDRAYNFCANLLIEEVSRDVQSVASKGISWITGKNIVEQKRRANVAVLFGTHNWDSCRLILDKIRETGLGSEGDRSAGQAITPTLDHIVRLETDAASRISIGQLYGMCDDLTEWIVRSVQSDDSPFVIKYVPYGPLSDVIPYLGRRAIENKSVLGGGAARDERRRAAQGILRKMGLGRPSTA